MRNRISLKRLSLARTALASLLVMFAAGALAAPTIVSTNPAEGAGAVSAGTTISITFSEAMNGASLTAQGAPGACSGSIQVSSDLFASCIALSSNGLSAGNTVATFTPLVMLDNNVKYRIRVTTAAQSVGSGPVVMQYTQSAGFTTIPDTTCATGLTISQVYGGGGSMGATYQSDFVEIHNPSNRTLVLSGHALQYSVDTSMTWTKVDLPSAMIAPGAYYLVGVGTPGAFGAPLPAPDFSTTAFNIADTAGKVALTSSTALLSGTCASSMAVVDFLGFGLTVNCANGMPGGAPSASSALIRRNGGCRNTANNFVDFAIAAPAPRNTATQPAVCTCTANETNSNAEMDYCNLSFPQNMMVDSGQFTMPVYARVYDAGLTEVPGANALIAGMIGYGAAGSNPATEPGWTWVPASFNTQVMNDDEYSASFVAPVAGAYRYTSRFTKDGINWTYCDVDGAGSNPMLSFDPNLLGNLTVNVGAPAAPQITSPNNATFVPGAMNSFFVTATGTPTPGYSVNGSLPAGLMFNGMTGELIGMPGIADARGWPLVFTAMNGVMPNATQNFALVVGTPPCSLDIDANGSIDALTDGLIVIRAMFGLTGTSVTSGALGTGAMRNSWTTIRAYLNGNCGANFAP